MTWRATGWRNACVGLLLMLVGCAMTRPPPALSSATDDASWKEVVPVGTTRYRLALGEMSSGGTPFQRATAVYPPELLVGCPSPQEVSALLIVDEAGKVGEVRVADEARADAGRRAFIAAVRVAARRWQFNPLTINRWAADADGNSHMVDSGAQPFSLAYVFRFECHAGKATVSAAAAKP